MKLGTENETLEFKKSTAELSVAMNAVSAMLNNHGYGIIYFGVKPNGDISGLSITENTTRDISRFFAEKIKPTIFPNIEILNYEGKEYIKVAFSGNNRPYSSDGKIYMRVADENRQITTDKLRELFEKTTIDYSLWESELTNETIEDIDMESFSEFRKSAENSGRITLSEDNTRELLVKLGLLKNEKLNNAGRYLFSKNNPINVKLAVFASDSQITFIDQNPRSGNIYQLKRIIQEYIESRINWRSIISKEKRKEIPEIPIDAIKETVLNSLCHANYHTHTSHEVSITPNKVSIYNPGRFPQNIKPEDFANNNLRSVIMNPLIANVLYRSKDIESWGTGLKRIYSLCNEAGVPVTYGNEEFGFCIVFARNSVMKDLSVDLSTKNMDDEDIAILIAIKSDAKITTIEIANRIFKSQATVIKKLKKLRALGMIKRVGSDKTGYWEINY